MTRILLTCVFALCIVEHAHAKPTRLFTRTISPIDHRHPAPSKPIEDLVIMSDGHFVHGASSGKLSRQALTELKRTLARTRFVLQPPGVTCTGLPDQRIQIKTPRGTIAWSTPCDRSPHRSVLTLEQTVLRLIATPEPRQDPNAPLLTYRVTRLHSLGRLRLPGEFTSPRAEFISIASDGSWQRQTERGTHSGQLSREALADLRERLKTVRLSAPVMPSICAARFEGEGSITIDGLGSYLWDVPCGSLDPSLASIITHLRRLTQD